MKKTIIILAIFTTSLFSWSAKTQKPLIKGSTIGTYQKPGASININYTSEHIEAGEISNINIEFISKLKEDFNIKISSSKEVSIKSPLTYTLNLSKKNILNIKVKTYKDGVFYINIFATLKNGKFRAFTIPIYVGSGAIEKKSSNNLKQYNGKNIILLPAKIEK